MSGRFALPLALALLAGAARADGPRLGVAEPAYDFGTVDQGARVEHAWSVRNTGTADLHIDHVKSSCGCTAAVVSSADVPPGGEGRVMVILDTARLVGRTTKVLTVYTNDPDTPAGALTITGEVAAELVATPMPLYLGKLRRGERIEREVRVMPGRPGVTTVVTAVEHTNPALHALLDALPEGGQMVTVELERDMPLGRFNDQLTLRTTGSRPLVIPVFGSVEGDVVVLPPQVTFGVARGGSVPERELYIHNRGVRPVAVTRVTVPAGVVSYRLSTVEDGQDYRLTLRLRDGLPAGKVESAIEIFTDHPDEQHLVVPLYAIIDGRKRG